MKSNLKLRWYYLGKFKPNDWVEIEDKALGVKAIGIINCICSDTNGRNYYQIQWKIVTFAKGETSQPTTLYPIDAFDSKGSLAANATVLYG